ncbi:hypothetical protein OsJ_02400 [Oryza sativa Japonica Group]|uniref:Uncharacterized protein n=1 Tax=Oryza sativa subsp. japonica TaxID=39947 RepID=B9EXS7_ORYSJ|nr:hypothetical protein OsJ_02400 [Oryza sativa Japonica Group]
MEKASLSPVTYRAAVGDDDEGKIGFLEGWERCSVIHLQRQCVRGHRATQDMMKTLDLAAIGGRRGRGQGAGHDDTGWGKGVGSSY